MKVLRSLEKIRSLNSRKHSESSEESSSRSSAARKSWASVTCKPPICVRGACHHSAPPKARVDQGQSGTSQNRSRRCQAVGLSGQAPSIAPVLAASAACAFIWDAELKSLKVWPPKAARSAEAQDFRAAQGKARRETGCRLGRSGFSGSTM